MPVFRPDHVRFLSLTSHFLHVVLYVVSTVLWPVNLGGPTHSIILARWIEGCQYINHRARSVAASYDIRAMLVRLILITLAYVG